MYDRRLQKRKAKYAQMCLVLWTEDERQNQRTEQETEGKIARKAEEEEAEMEEKAEETARTKEKNSGGDRSSQKGKTKRFVVVLF